MWPLWSGTSGCHNSMQPCKKPLLLGEEAQLGRSKTWSTPCGRSRGTGLSAIECWSVQSCSRNGSIVTAFWVWEYPRWRQSGNLAAAKIGANPQLGLFCMLQKCSAAEPWACCGSLVGNAEVCGGSDGLDCTYNWACFQILRTGCRHLWWAGRSYLEVLTVVWERERDCGSLRTVVTTNLD